MRRLLWRVRLWFRRRQCNNFGHPEPAVGVGKDRRLTIFCPRCGLIWSGEKQEFAEIF